MDSFNKKFIKLLKGQSVRDKKTANQIVATIEKRLPDPNRLIREGHDRQHVVYILGQHIAGIVTEILIELPEFAEFAQESEAAADEYMPGYPPISPITNSYFSLWQMFDLTFGPNQQTVGSCILKILRSLDAPESLRLPIDKLCESRMGIYQHLGKVGDKIKLQELVTGDEFKVLSTSKYIGRRDELWFVRLCPP